MDVSGYTRFKIKGCQIRAIVSKSFKDEILLGWRDLVRLNVIPATFPSLGGAAQVSKIDHQEADDPDLMKVKTKLMTEFNDVFSDTLPENPMKGPDMKIELTDGPIRPRCATTCKEVPKHWEEDAKKLVDKLVSDGVIEAVPTVDLSSVIRQVQILKRTNGSQKYE